MKQDLRGFAMANPEKLEQTTQIVEGYIKRDGVIKKMKKDLLGFSLVNPEKLKQLEKKWGQQLMRERLEKYSLRNQIFKRNL